MLYIVGAGLKPVHMTLEGINALKKCERVFFETYTSSYSEGNIEESEKIVGKKVFSVSRKTLEEGSKEFLKLAKKNNIALIIIGNPLTATTHIQLILEAHRQRIETKIIAGISLTNYLAKTGLDEYKFGRICTIAEHHSNFEPDSFYDVIEKNKLAGLHTLCLLDTGDGKKFLSSQLALKILEKIEKEKKKNLLSKCTFVVLAGAGSKNEQVVWGKLEKIKRTGIAVFPQSIIVCGDLNEKEKEVLSELNE